MAIPAQRVMPQTRPDAFTLLAVTALAGVAAYAWAETSGRNSVAHRPRDHAPARAARIRDNRSRTAQGRTVTIARPRSDVWSFLRNASNLPRFMTGVLLAEAAGDRIRLVVRTPRGRSADFEVVVKDERENEKILWHSAEGSPIDIEGAVTLRDAPAGRGTEVTGLVRWSPPGGRAGHAVAKAAGRDPRAQVRRQLKRLKMLLEAGEIATSQSRSET